MKTWITTDFHLNHINIKKYEDRPEGFESLILKHHQELIKPEDILINLGDVVFGSQFEIKPYLDQIICRSKILVRGNHDKASETFYLKNGFDSVVDGVVLRNILFTHAPKPITDMRFNVHGHLHSGRHRNDIEAFHYDFYGSKNILLGIENTNYYPVSLEDIINGRYTREVDGYQVIVRR